MELSRFYHSSLDSLQGRPRIPTPFCLWIAAARTRGSRIRFSITQARLTVLTQMSANSAPIVGTSPLTPGRPIYFVCPCRLSSAQSPIIFLAESRKEKRQHQLGDPVEIECEKKPPVYEGPTSGGADKFWVSTRQLFPYTIAQGVARYSTRTRMRQIFCFVSMVSTGNLLRNPFEFHVRLYFLLR
jgi:hypothetical protein